MRYLYTFLIVISIFLNWRCSSEINIDRDTNDSIIHEVIPVDFNIEGIISMNSRDIHKDSKHSFIEGEKIHVGATFYDDDEEIIKYAYTVMILTGGKWIQSDVFNEMMWPPNAKRGEFQAYFVDNHWYTDAPLKVGDKFPHILNLSDFTETTDPLVAKKEEMWGHTINLQFKHLCTHLTFTNLDPDIADYFWLVKKGNDDFCNGFSLRVDSLNNLIAEFSKLPDSNFDGLVYVQNKAESFNDNENNKKSRVSFFLEPGDYSDIELRTINNYSYLAFQSEETSNLEANIPYVIEVNKSSGTTFIEKKEDWDIPENWEATEVEPDKFIESIVKGSDYFIIDKEKGDTIMIIERTLVGTALRRNVDFKNNKEYVDLLDVRPEIGSNQVFDGGNHFICNIATNIFTENHGTIKNLGLHSVECKDVTVSQNKEYWGVLCQQNFGNITDIRLDESYIKINIGDHNSNTSINVGTLIGANSNGSSKLTDVVYSGNIRLETSDQENVECNLYLGGFMGQLEAGSIDGIKMYDSGADNSQSKIEVINRLRGQKGCFYVGGAVGVGITDIEKINLHSVIVDCSESKGQNEYTGGLVGQLRSSIDNPSIMSLSSVEGIVKGGDIENITTESARSYSYTGGITGSMLNYKVVDCSTICDVQGPENAEIKDDETYATGGAFGIIVSKTDVKNNVAWGNSLAGPTGGYIANFVGIAPEGCNWDYYYSSGNRAFDLLGTGIYVGFNQE